MVVSSTVERGFELCSGQLKDYAIDKQAAKSSKNKY